MQKFWDMVLSHFLNFTVVVLEVMIFQNKKSVVLEVGKNHKDCFDSLSIEIQLQMIVWHHNMGGYSFKTKKHLCLQGCSHWGGWVGFCHTGF